MTFEPMEPMERDAELGAALRDQSGESSLCGAEWATLRAKITDHAAPELARRRRARRLRFAIPASLAAGIALLVLARGPELMPVEPTGDPGIATAGEASIDALLDGSLSERQVRALLSGAGDADNLLLIAAEDPRP
jgi:hypothetical protein